MARQKKVLITGITREQAEESFARYAAADARQQKITAQMDVQITKIRERYSDELTKLEEVKENAFNEIQVFAENNREQFGQKKSLELLHGIIGFRTGTPKLKTLKGFTWNSVTNLLKEFLPGYIRTEESPAKDRLLADRENPDTYKQFSKCGIFVDQDESFYVEPKKEEVLGS